MIAMTTSLGEFFAELYPDKAPGSVANFLEYVDDGFYAGTLFHRVIPGFMIQGGGFALDMRQKTPRAPIHNEADNGLRNTRGTLAMARTSDLHSATSQFFINLADNTFLDHGRRDFGYAVFGRVSQGMEILDAIARVKTSRQAGHQDVPVDPVVLHAARRMPRDPV